MSQASLAFVLHAHLPFVRHPAHEDFLEERWLAEAITETYIPLLEMLGALERDRVPARRTLSLSPPLLAMLADHLLRGRYLRHLDRLVELAEKEERRTRADERFHRVAEMYLARFYRARTIFLEDWGQDLIAAFRSYQERGLLAPRVRLRARARRRARPRRRALLLRRHARHRTRHAAARVRRLRAHRLRLRGGGLRARPRQLEAGGERRGGLPGRLLVPRLLPRHRLRSRLRLRAPLSAAHRAAHPDRPQLPPHHRQDRREGPLRARARPRAARGARGALRRGPRPPGGLAGARHGPAADHRLPLRRGALRALVVRGAVVAGGGPAPPRRHAPAARRDPGRGPRPPPDRAARHAGRLHLGLEGLQRSLARGRERLALPPPPRHRGPSPRALPELPERGRAHAPRAHPGAARALPRAGE